MDASDGCPDAAEDRDAIEDGDGCPEDDADADHIPDTEDACPTEAGGVLVAERGCPFALPPARECAELAVPIEIRFDPADVAPTPAERDLVSVLAQNVAALPTGTVLDVVGHRAVDEPIDSGLERAEAVRQILRESGLAAARLHMVNRADREATADTADNRRVSFRLALPCVTEHAADYRFQAPVPPRTLPPDAPAMHYANLSPGACRAELTRRKLPIQRDRRPTPGVATGVRFTGPIHGVTLVAPGKPTTFGVMDCRLALAFDDVTAILADYGIVRIRIDNTYRRGAHLPNRHHGRSQHAYGLAADITAFYFEDGRELNVEHDWDGQLGDPVCGPDATLDHPTEDAIALRDIACELGRRGFFHTMLTPDYNAAHRNHFHFDIKRDAKRWGIY